MRIPFQRRRNKAGLDEARAAREKAERELEQARAETPKYRALGRALKEMREDNHLAQALTQSFRSDH